MDDSFTMLLGLVSITAIIWAHVALYTRWKSLNTIEKIVSVASLALLTLMLIGGM